MSDTSHDLVLSAAFDGWDRLRQPIWVFDPFSFRGLYANPPALKLWDAASQDELLARDFSKLSTAVLTRVERLALATAGGEAVAERWTFYPRGQPVTVQAVISSLALGGGRTALLFEADAVEVEQGERRAVEALRHTSSLITLFDPEGRALFANPAAFAAYGEGEVGFIERFEDPAQGAAALEQVLAGEVLAELRQMRTRGGERSHHLDARSVLDPVTGQSSVLLSERDVTAQVEAERALAAAQERAEVALAKQRFLANMSHELRTPLNSVLGFAQLLGSSGLNGSQDGHLSRITSSGHALLEVINDLIGLAELDQGDIRLDLAPFDPSALALEALESIEGAATAKGLALELRAAGEPSLIGDGARLRRVIDAYVSNAVKFTEHGQVALEVDMHDLGDRARLEIAVVDTGPGLDGAAQSQLFQRFAPGDDSRTKKFSGGGLGLALAQELMALMGGEVGVDSVPGQGARFWLRLELPIADPATEQDGDSDQRDRAFNVLYADDNESNRVLVQTVLASQGHRCDVVNDGAEAIAAVGAGDYDLVLMDIQMPVKDGVEATIEIRALPAPFGGIPVLAVTANTLSDQRAAYAAAGMNDCIAKPVSMVELITKVTHWAAVAERPPAQTSKASLASSSSLAST